jgi:hypothetical protein
MELFDLEQTTPDPATQFRFQQILENELGLKDAAEVAIGAIEAILAPVTDQPPQGHRGDFSAAIQR